MEVAPFMFVLLFQQLTKIMKPLVVTRDEYKPQALNTGSYFWLISNSVLKYFLSFAMVFRHAHTCVLELSAGHNPELFQIYRISQVWVWAITRIAPPTK